ncbi:hypothetical protein [Budvicia aquatica]|uniref:Uncharacterized protein n=1 Tax=Budvicia aquatica TaxID=82979 RepID=A0A485A1L7_9GAMM|nr:hypothetical protein [Budvicia aquatica]VFS51409.1 Uncharacterised protein [Budvicia aquatica]
MRYYRIEITDENGGPINDSEGNVIGPWDTEKTKGVGLHVVFDIPTLGLDAGIAGASLAVFGLPLSILRHAVNLRGARITMYGGFQDGLPLANPEQSGVVVNGWISMAYGNWVGVNQSLNLTISPIPWLTEEGKGIAITLSGERGDKLSDVIRRGLTPAFPEEFPIKINIRDNLILREPLKVPCYTIFAVAVQIKRIVQSLSGGDTSYAGIRVVAHKGSIEISDDSYEPEEKDIAAKDLIGQPCWLGPMVMSFKTPLRTNLSINDRVKLPESLLSGSPLVVGSQQSKLPESARLNFSGIFQIIAIRHIGEFCNHQVKRG